MNAKPATRFYVEAGLAPGASIALSPGQGHQLKAVLRCAPGDAVALFNGRNGEWLARIETLARNECTATAEEQLRPQEDEGDLWLVFAPVKRARLDYLVEKATELGASALCPVLTERTIVDRLNPERLAAILREAAEQSERLTLPELRVPLPLSRLLAEWPGGRHLILCDETGTAPPAAAALAALPPGPRAVLVGPEGGFAETELDALRKLPFVCPVGLGPRVLRSDTAALAGLAVAQAVGGDWSVVRRRRLRGQAV